MCNINTISWSQEKTDTSLSFDPIIITQDRIDIPINENARHINIIEKDRIKCLPVSNVNELLQFQTGVDVRRRGVNGVQSDISIRGGSFGQTLIMLNGMSLSDPQSAHHNMNLPLLLDEIERIEIIKGPAARVYGQNAFSGVINIISNSKFNKSTKARFRTNFGSYGTFETGLNIQIPSVNINQSIILNTANSNGYKYNTDYKIRSLFYTASIGQESVNPLNIMAGLVDRKFGANGFYANEKFIDQYEETNTQFVSISTKRIFSNFVIKPRVSWRRNKDVYVFLRHNPAYYKNEHISSSLNAEIHGKYESIFGTTGLGFDWNKESLKSNNLGNHDRNIFGVFLEHRFFTFKDKMNVTLGVYSNKIDDSKIVFHPGLDVSYALNRWANIFLSINKASRIPSYTNLYYHSPTEVGNDQLVSEYALSYEFGLKWHNKWWESTWSSFYIKNTNLIDWVKEDINDNKWKAVNYQATSIKGIDFSNRFNFGKFLSKKNIISLNIDYHFLDSKIVDNKSYSISRYALQNIKHQMNLGFTYGLFSDNILLNVQYRYLDRVSLNNYSLFDTNLILKLEDVKINFRINNIMNIRYKETNLVTMPGRSYSISFIFES